MNDCFSFLGTGVLKFFFWGSSVDSSFTEFRICSGSPAVGILVAHILMSMLWFECCGRAWLVICDQRSCAFYTEQIHSFHGSKSTYLVIELLCMALARHCTIVHCHSNSAWRPNTRYLLDYRSADTGIFSCTVGVAMMYWCLLHESKLMLWSIWLTQFSMQVNALHSEANDMELHH